MTGQALIDHLSEAIHQWSADRDADEPIITSGYAPTTPLTYAEIIGTLQRHLTVAQSALTS